jgi:hypothetical protein
MKELLLTSIPIFLLIAIAALLIYFHPWFNPTVIYPPPPPNCFNDPTLNGCPSSAFRITHLGGQYYSFDYPSNYKVLSDGPTNTGELEVTKLEGLGAKNSRTIAIAYLSLKGASLSEYPAVHYRQISPSIYTPSTTEVAGTGGLNFQKLNEGSESSVFLVKGGNVASIAVSSLFVDPQVDKDFQIIVRSFTWR